MKINTPKILLLLASVCLFSTTFAQSEKQRIAKYVEQYKELAIAEMIRTGVPASITLAQGALETGMGQSDLALNANNHFGIKCKAEWKGETIIHDDDQKGECFRKYPTVEDSYRDHSDFLRTRKNYAALFLIDPVDYSGWAYGLKKAGYATNPTYPQRLMRIIEENNLQQYTMLALQRKLGGSDVAVETKPADEVKIIETKQQYALIKKDDAAVVAVRNEDAAEQQQKSEDVQIADAGTKQIVLEEAEKTIYPAGVFSINATKVMLAPAGTSLLAIANNNSISYSKLIEFNELDTRDILEKDQLIFLEKKPKKGAKEIHIVTANETLHDICQKEGIQLSSVLELNHLQKGMKPAVGEKLFLKAKAVSSPKLVLTDKRETSTSMR